MTPDEWRRINAIFHEALERPAASREAFVDQACADRPDLAADVRSLLAAHARAGGFLESGAAVAAPGDDPAAAPLVGRTVGHYRIDGLLGAGGMGVVYLAHDLSLGRSVALKAVAPSYTDAPARRERLRREARAAAALTHPGIATVYALEEIDGQIFMAGEYVPGETLRDELARGPLPPARALETAAALARALAAAHDRGVVHRDLKPENVIRTPAGDVKILDFGLARMRDVPASLAQLTDDGTLLGTPAYMSPEQIRGETVDGRSDLFSLGVVLYELVTGRHPFAGGDPASTIAKILEAEPARVTPVEARAGDRVMLGAIEEIVRGCVRKAPAARFPSGHELAAAIDRARSGQDVGGPPPVTGSSAAAWWWQFHQAAVCVIYPVLVGLLWTARGELGTRTGRLIFLAGLMAASAGVALRLHLWFTLHQHRSGWARQQQDTGGWIRLADVLLAAALLAGGLLVADSNTALGGALVASAAATAVSSAVIERATAARVA